MRKVLFIFILFCSAFVFSQEEASEADIEIVNTDNYQYVEHGVNYIEQRQFNKDLKSKYSGYEFQYQEEKVRKKTKPQNLDGLFNFFSFLGAIFPYLLVAIVVFIIVKSILANDVSFWKLKKKKIVKASIVTSEEEDALKQNDFEKLLSIAKQKGNFRKATRFYYLLLLKRMDEKKLIQYDKDKTNTEYIFDVQPTFRKHFSYLLYIYDYVWYGEFNVDEISFKKIEDEYQSFLKKL